MVPRLIETVVMRIIPRATSRVPAKVTLPRKRIYRSEIRTITIMPSMINTAGGVVPPIRFPVVTMEAISRQILIAPLSKLARQVFSSSPSKTGAESQCLVCCFRFIFHPVFDVPFSNTLKHPFLRPQNAQGNMDELIFLVCGLYTKYDSKLYYNEN